MYGPEQYLLSQTQKKPQLTRKKLSGVHNSIRICLCRPWNSLLPAGPLVKGLGYILWTCFLNPNPHIRAGFDLFRYLPVYLLASGKLQLMRDLVKLDR